MKNINIFTYEFWEAIIKKLHWNEKINGSICSTKGRISRFPFFIYSIILIAFKLLLTHFIIDAAHSNQQHIEIGLSIPLIGSIYIDFMLTIKRLHDLNLSGWFVLAPIFFTVLTKNDDISMLGEILLIIWFFILFFVTGSKKKNKYNIKMKNKPR